MILPRHCTDRNPKIKFNPETKLKSQKLISHAPLAYKEFITGGSKQLYKVAQMYFFQLVPEDFD